MQELGSLNLVQHRKNIIEELKKRDEEAKNSAALIKEEQTQTQNLEMILESKKISNAKESKMSINILGP